jgi:hypothetical protein
MSGLQELSKPERSKPARLDEGDGDWVDFPANSEPAPWEALLPQANRGPIRSGGKYRGNRAAGGLSTSVVALAARGLLVASGAVATVAYLLLTNSHV